MCGHPFEDVPHTIHFCPMWSRVASPGKHYCKAVFIKFLKDNPQAFAFLWENHDHEEERRYVENKVGAGAPGPSHSPPLSSLGSAQPRVAPSPPRVTWSKPSVNIHLTDMGTTATYCNTALHLTLGLGGSRNSKQTNIHNFFVRQ